MSFSEWGHISSQFTVENNIQLIALFERVNDRLDHVQKECYQCKRRFESNWKDFLSCREDLMKLVVQRISWDGLDVQKFKDCGYSDGSDLIYLSSAEIFKILKVENAKDAVAFRKRMDQILLEESSQLHMDTLVEELVLNGWRYFQLDQACLNASNLWKQMDEVRASCVDVLKEMDTKMKWMFSLKKRRDRFVHLYEECIYSLDHGLFDSIEDLVRLSADLKGQSVDVKDMLVRDPLSVFEMLRLDSSELSRELFTVRLQDIGRVLSEYEACSFDFDGILSNLKGSIVSGCDRLVDSMVMVRLSNMALEQLNECNDEGSIRISPLKKCGYSSLADVALFSEEELIAVNGIGPESARLIVQTLSKIVSSLKKELKIQLSYDDQSNCSSDLVLALYRYSLIKDAYGQLLGLDAYSECLLQASYYDVLSANCLYWPFSLEKNVSRVVNGMDLLDCILNGLYGGQRLQIVQSVQSVMNCSVEKAWQAFKEDPIRFTFVLEELIPECVDTVEDVEFGLPVELAKDVESQDVLLQGLSCRLRNYQVWGVKYILHQERVLLGDEMGLGKTVQAIAAMVSLRNVGATHFLVVCPASVLTNWCREIVKHSDLNFIKIHGANKLDCLQEWKCHGGVGVTTYEMTGFFDFLRSDFFDFLVVDEAHYVKNPKAIRTQNVKKMIGHTNRVLLMTGTPLENRTDEMVHLIGMLRMDVAEQVKGMSQLIDGQVFRDAIASVYFRRRREDVLKELPQLIEVEDWCSLSSCEQSVYEDSILSKNFMASRRVSWNVDDLNVSCKAQRLLEIVDEACKEHRKVIVFSYFLETIDRVKALLKDVCIGPITGSVLAANRQAFVDAFEKAEDGAVLLAQIEAGGTGLNIQAASVVVICEPQLKPSMENQAISRAYRMGQSRNVLVHRLLCENTIDERIMNILEEKQEIFDVFADQSVAAQKIDLDEKGMLSHLIDEEIVRIQEKRKLEVH